MRKLYPSKPMAEETPRNEQQTSAPANVDLTSLTDLDLGPRWSSGSVLENTPRLNFREERDRGPRPPRTGGPRRDRRPPRSEGEARPVGAASAEGREPRGNRPPRREYSRPAAPPPPFQPIVQVALYPEDGPFKLLGNAIKNSGRTYELFEIARLILEKAERFVVVVHPLPEAQPQSIFISLPDNMPFESEEAALNHVFTANLANFFDIEEVEVDPPKGNFIMVNRCGVTGELLAPPNYHKYQQILQAHYTAHCSNMSYDRFLSRIEGVHEKEAIDQWVEKMKKQTRYKLKEAIEGSPSDFDTLESARFALVLHSKDKLVRVVPNARFEGRSVDQMPTGPIRKSIETIVEQQRRFPLDTANNLRGRLRRMGFSVYKKGSKGISYVCAIRRNFRKVGEVFSESIQQLIEFIEAHPGFPASDLPKEYLGAQIPAEGEAAMQPQDLERLKQLRTDLRWLITSGYVTEYSNGKLFSPPPQTNPAPAEEETAVEGAEASSGAETAAPAAATPAAEAVTDVTLTTGAPVALADALNVPEEAPAVQKAEAAPEAPIAPVASAAPEAPATPAPTAPVIPEAPATEEKPAS
jgi:hypothetical protein